MLLKVVLEAVNIFLSGSEPRRPIDYVPAGSGCYLDTFVASGKRCIAKKVVSHIRGLKYLTFFFNFFKSLQNIKDTRSLLVVPVIVHVPFC
jgi:hypothetical protein